MNSRTILMLVVALILASGAVLLAKRLLDTQTNTQSANVEPTTIQVYVAAAEIPVDTKIESTHLKLIAWPKDNLLPEAFTEEDIKKEPNAILGKMAKRFFYPGEPLLKPQIIDESSLKQDIKDVIKEDDTTLDKKLSEDKRAITVRVDDVNSVAGFVLPGTKVDILVTNKGKSQTSCLPEAAGYKIVPVAAGSLNQTYTLLRGIEVLAIDQLSAQEQHQATVGKALTLQVYPGHAECLMQAMITGTLHFSLRNRNSKIIPEKVMPEVLRSAKPRSMVTVLPWGESSFYEWSHQCDNGNC